MTSSVRTITSVAFLACLFVLTTAKCNQLCTQEWNPVCAKNFNGQYHTFVNPCEFEVAQCENPAASWTRTRNGVCAQTRKDCPKICTAEWEPVCAKNTDGKFRTFGNPCEFDVAQCENPAASWTRTRNGVCAQTRKECPKVCTEEWKPVCAKNTDGKFHTFGNPCEFEVAQCMNPAASWTRTRNGVCAQTRKECAKVCTAEWKPVCAKNTGGKFHTFGNPCEFEVAQCMNPAASWTRTRNGVCAQTRNECAKVCTAEWKPVCAKNTDGKFHTFGNPCEFEVAQCKNPAASWTRTRNGVCAQTRKECPKICTAEWKPVCAKNTDGKFHTFGNPCEFEVAQCETPAASWTRTRNGVCAQTRKECPKVCTEEWKPVCAKNTDGKFHTFGNPCEFEVAQCMNPAASWTRTRNGVCAQTRKECAKVCTAEWKPVCAKNTGGKFHTFGNPCEFEVAQCMNPAASWTRTRNGVCAQTRNECAKVCTAEWKPVCAKNTDGKFHTFGNPCEFEVAQCKTPAASWTRTRNGVCAQTRKECPKTCTAEWRPVCAKNTDGKFHTFANPCEFEVAECLTPFAGWMITRDGVCAQTREECAKVCTAEWKPVCAKNLDGSYQTFGNTCKFEAARCLSPAAGWTTTRYGVCAQTRKECPKICSIELNPICAKNYKGEIQTFGNPCQLETAQCNNPLEGWFQTKIGEC